MSDFSSSSGTVPSSDQAATPQHPAVPMTTPPLSPPLGSSPASVRQFTFPSEPSSVQQPPIVTQPSLVEQYPVVSQLHAYTSFAPPVFSRPQPTATTQDQFRYGMPQMPDFTAAPIAPPPRAPTFFPASVLVPLPPPPRDPLQENMVDTQSNLVDHLACLMEVVHRQIYWQMRQIESLFDTHHHLYVLWENAMLSDSVPPFRDMSPLWSPAQDLPEGPENAFTSSVTHQETTNPIAVPHDESSFFHPYYTPTHRVSLENTNGRSASRRRRNRRRIPCRICHQEGHVTYSCPRRHRTGCYLCGDPSHRMRDCVESRNSPPSLPPPHIRTTSSSEPNITAPNPPPQPMCSLCGQPAHHGDTCGP